MYWLAGLRQHVRCLPIPSSSVLGATQYAPFDACGVFHVPCVLRTAYLQQMPAQQFA